MDRKEFKSLKIPTRVKVRIDLLKGRQTYEEFFSNVLSYFETTGVNPKHDQLPPAVSIIKVMQSESTLIYKRLDDVIKIIRNIESNKIDGILRGVDVLNRGASESASDIGPTEEYNYALIKEVERLKVLLKEKDKTISDLRYKIENFSDTRCVVETVRELLSDRVLGAKIDGNYVLTEKHRNQLIEKIEQI